MRLRVPTLGIYLLPILPNSCSYAVLAVEPLCTSFALTAGANVFKYYQLFSYFHLQATSTISKVTN